jgi:hypothetical protein
MLKTAILVCTAVLILAGCAETASQSNASYHWRDISGKERSERLALSDVQTCRKMHPMPKDAEPSAEKLALEHFDACMRQRGWEIVRG